MHYPFGLTQKSCARCLLQHSRTIDAVEDGIGETRQLAFADAVIGAILALGTVIMEPFIPDSRDRALRFDRRLLGRLLGEVIRDQIGAGTLEVIENIRRGGG